MHSLICQDIWKTISNLFSSEKLVEFDRIYRNIDNSEIQKSIKIDLKNIVNEID